MPRYRKLTFPEERLEHELDEADKNKQEYPFIEIVSTDKIMFGMDVIELYVPPKSEELHVLINGGARPFKDYLEYHGQKMIEKVRAAIANDNFNENVRMNELRK